MDFSTAGEHDMWKVLKGKRKFIGTNEEYEYKYIQRQDGFTLIREGMGRELEENFLCTGDFGEFRFFANRWDQEKNKSFDYYIVSTKLHSRDWPLDKLANEQLILTHSKDIESGLFHFPPSRYFDYKPVKKVWFDLSRATEPRHLVSAEEISKEIVIQ